ncbi:hypothetical protein DRJ17_02005 [Candidatus Woesearchaeota archaeon]|nr:MAG: hypothetical protein DRJ17_02005 [Candidatus Woesearchaeota archaeon]
MDLFCAVTIVLLNYGLINKLIAVGAILYLIVKGFMFRKDISSILDVISGLYMCLLLLGFGSILTFIFVVYLVEKGIISLA